MVPYSHLHFVNAFTPNRRYCAMSQRARAGIKSIWKHKVSTENAPKTITLLHNEPVNIPTSGNIATTTTHVVYPQITRGFQFPRGKFGLPLALLRGDSLGVPTCQVPRGVGETVLSSSTAVTVYKRSPVVDASMAYKRRMVVLIHQFCKRLEEWEQPQPWMNTKEAVHASSENVRFPIESDDEMDGEDDDDEENGYYCSDDEDYKRPIFPPQVYSNYADVNDSDGEIDLGFIVDAFRPNEYSMFSDLPCQDGPSCLFASLVECKEKNTSVWFTA